MLNIGVFGGSFDPVHIEHIKIIDVIFSEFNMDKVIVVPAYNPPHKKFLNTSSIDRLNMLELVTKKLKNVIVDTCEIDSQKVVYTYETLDYLKNKYSNSRLNLVIGADSFNQLDTWKKPIYIAQQYGFLVINRAGSYIDVNSKYLKYSKFSKFVGSVSSTLVREKLKNKLDVSKLLDNEVANYIKENELYK